MKRKKLLFFVGFGIVSFIILAAISIYLFFPDTGTNTPTPQTETSTTSAAVSNQDAEKGSIVSWNWNGNNWTASGTAPECPKPLLTVLPVDLNLVEGILYPGQSRGGDYKAHGGFRFATTTNSISVKIPLNSHVTSASRYIEGGEVQYFFNFTSSCGIAYRFDHLLTLTEKFQKIADALPEARVDDSRTTRIDPPVEVEQGEQIATEIGFANNKNVFVDFGVYDLRKTNLASKNPDFAARHSNFREFIFYGICWLDHYPSEVSTQLKALPAGGLEGKVSDYCS